MKSLITHSPIGSCLWIIGCVGAVASTSPLSPLLARGGGRRRAAGTRLMNRSRGLSRSPGKRCVSGAPMNQAQGRWGSGGVGGQGCPGSVRLAPACSATKGRIVRCRQVWIKVSGVGQAGRKTGMSCGLQRANRKGCFHSINGCSRIGQGFLVVVVYSLLAKMLTSITTYLYPYFIKYF